MSIGTNLASSGIGHISVLDYDRVAIHNLARQIIFKKEDVGRYKAEVISKYINDYYPDCSINHYNIFNSNNADRLISNHDIVIDATDDINTRYLINDNCVFYDKPLVYAALYKYEGQLTVFNYKMDQVLGVYIQINLVTKKSQPASIQGCWQLYRVLLLNFKLLK